MTASCEIGLTGLATMGANLARNAARKGFPVAVHNRHRERTDALVREHGPEGTFVAATTPQELVAAIKRPRPIVIMVKAGKPVDQVIDELAPHLDEGDILIDGGNSLFTDTRRRVAALAGKGIRFIGMGVSGGEEGALEGPSMMPGGDREAYARIEPMVTRMAAQVDGTPCCAYMGADGARPLRQDGAQRHRIRRHAADRRGLRHPAQRLRPGRRPHRRDLRALEER